MEKFENSAEILNFAIKREIEAHDFYTNLAKKMSNSAMKQTFEQFAIEEMGHKMKLEAVKAGEVSLASEKVTSLGIADYVVEGKAEKEMDYGQALILAMNKEKAAFKLYLDLADAAENQELKNTFLALAQEEAKHKLRFELEYDENVLKED